jgi:hypothetical protein
MLWNNIHKYAGYALFGGFCIGLGNVAGTAEYKVPYLWGQASTLQRVEHHDIPRLKALIPKDVGSKKSESPTTEPNCIPPHPEPQ